MLMIHLAASLLTGSVAFAALPSDPGDLVITEFMAQPTGREYFGEWFEIYNASGLTLELEGLSVDDGTEDERFVLDSALSLEPGARTVLGTSSDTNPSSASYNGGVNVDFEWDLIDFELDYRADSIRLVFDGRVIDQLVWDASWAVPADSSFQLSPYVLHLPWARSLKGSWCGPEDTYGTWGYPGNPGLESEECPGDSSDDDGDGYAEDEGDCDDDNPIVNPSVVDGSAPPYGSSDDDGNCNGIIDDGALDMDGDGYSPEEGDCDDDDPLVNPDRSERSTADGKDNDCNCFIDDLDTDNDGYNSDRGATHYSGACEEQDPSGWDCDDTNDSIHPDRPEVFYDAVDQDCDGLEDECDQDEDGYDADPLNVCPDVGCCPGGDDCNDRRNDVNPGASEGKKADQLDNDCNGTVDDAFQDLDDDGFTVGDGDCWDSANNLDAKKVHPGAVDVCSDYYDNDCDGLINEGCSNQTGFATVSGGGCSTSDSPDPRGIAAFALAAILLGARRRYPLPE